MTALPPVGPALWARGACFFSRAPDASAAGGLQGDRCRVPRQQVGDSWVIEVRAPGAFEGWVDLGEQPADPVGCRGDLGREVVIGAGPSCMFSSPPGNFVQQRTGPATDAVGGAWCPSSPPHGGLAAGPADIGVVRVSPDHSFDRGYAAPERLVTGDVRQPSMVVTTDVASAATQTA
jgi:hypothetical protein